MSWSVSSINWHQRCDCVLRERERWVWTPTEWNTLLAMIAPSRRQCKSMQCSCHHTRPHSTNSGTESPKSSSQMTLSTVSRTKLALKSSSSHFSISSPFSTGPQTTILPFSALTSSLASPLPASPFLRFTTFSHPNCFFSYIACLIACFRCNFSCFFNRYYNHKNFSQIFLNLYYINCFVANFTFSYILVACLIACFRRGFSCFSTSTIIKKNFRQFLKTCI